MIDNRVMVPHAALDHDGYRAWVKSDEYPERVRTAFVSGYVLVEMTPESISAHNQVKLAFTETLGAFVREHDLGTLYPDGLLITNEGAELSCEPDLTFISWATFEAGGVQLVPRATGPDHIEMLGSPDLVVEIISDSSVRKDTPLLRGAYARAGVQEYWLVDARGADVRFEILTAENGVFQPGAPATEPQSSRVLSGRWALTRARNRVGHFTYTLACL